MSAFTRIRVSDIDKAIRLASNHAIEHSLMPFSGMCDEWVTMGFTTPHGKRAFDRVCAENEITVQDSVVVNRMLDAMMEDDVSPSDILEKTTITPGMARAIGRGTVKYRCVGCELAIPRYAGAYPRSCPSCGGDLQDCNHE